MLRHQLSLRRWLIYFGLITMAIALLNVAFKTGDLVVSCYGILFLAFSTCCPIGYVIAGKKGEGIGAVVALVVAVVIGATLSIFAIAVLRATTVDRSEIDQ